MFLGKVTQALKVDKFFFAYCSYLKTCFEVYQNPKSKFWVIEYLLNVQKQKICLINTKLIFLESETKLGTFQKGFSHTGVN